VKVIYDKERYILFEVLCEERSETLVKPEIYRAIREFLGTLGFARSWAVIIEYNESSGKGILMCRNKELNVVILALTLITKIHDKPASVRVRLVSGTIKRLKKKGGI